VIGVLGIGREITERRRSEKERETLRAQLFDARHMESVGRLAGGVAHDFNNLLSPVLAYSQLLMEQAGQDTETHEFLEQINVAAQRARGLVKQLLVFGRKQSLSLENADLSEVVESFSMLIRGNVPETVQISYDLGEGLPPVRIDRPRVEQALMNLVLNGSAAMPEGGVLTVCTEPTRIETQSPWHLTPGDYVQLSVSDTGTGISEEAAQHIFEPFYTTKGSRGHGLGLSTVFGLAKQHGGAVRAESVEGVGAVFRVLLPVSQARVVQPKPSKARQKGPPKGTERVLLVEDEQQVRKLTQRILARKGYEVCVATNGLEALQVLESQRSLISLVLTDVVMPEMNGVQLMEHVVERWPDLKVAMMTGYSQDLLPDHGVLDSQYSILQKPFTATELLTMVREVLDQPSIS